MKRAMLAGAVLALTTLGTSPLYAQQTSTPQDVVVATVDGAEIRTSDVGVFYENLPAQYKQVPLESIFPQLVERLVDQQLIANAARRSGIADRPQVKKRIRFVTQGVLNQVYMDERLKSVVTESRLRDEYQKKIALEPKREEVRARHILVKTRAEAMIIIADLEKGEDFVTLAKAKSTGPSGRNGGDLGYFADGQMVPPFSKVAFALKRGAYSREPVKTQFGWHIIKVEDRRVSGSRSFEQLSGEIRQKLTDQVYESTIRDLRSTAKVDIRASSVSKIQPIR
jgi:peptidyl-prolyl cis-trans isomerase C